MGLHCIDAVPEDFQSLPELPGARKRQALRGVEPRQPGREDNEDPDIHVRRPARDLEAAILGGEADRVDVVLRKVEPRRVVRPFAGEQGEVPVIAFP